MEGKLHDLFLISLSTGCSVSHCNCLGKYIEDQLKVDSEEDKACQGGESTGLVHSA